MSFLNIVYTINVDKSTVFFVFFQVNVIFNFPLISSYSEHSLENYKKISSVLISLFPSVVSPIVLKSTILIIEIKSSFLLIIDFNSFSSSKICELVKEPLKTDFCQWLRYFLHFLNTLFTRFSPTS